MFFYRLAMTYFIINLGFGIGGDTSGFRNYTGYFIGQAHEYEEEESIIHGEEFEDAYEEIYESLGIKEIEKQLGSYGYTEHISFSDILKSVFSGNGEAVANNIIYSIKAVLVGDLVQNKNLMLQLIVLVLIGSIFVNISGSFGNSFVSENGFFVTYLIITSIMLASFSLSLELVSNTIERVLNLIRILVPLYAVSMNFVGYSSTSSGMYQIILVGVWLVQVVILKFIIPMIKFYVIVSLVNNLNKEDSFSKLCNLIKSLVSWMLKTIVVFVAGLNIIKSLIDPHIDALGRDTVNRVIASIPGGGIVSVLSGTFLGAGLVIKNSIGIGGIILIIMVVLGPVLKTFLLMFAVRITTVVIQPVGERRYVDGIESLAQGMVLLLHTILSSVVLFVLTIAIMAYSSSGG